MKKLLIGSLSLMTLFGLASCNQNAINSSNTSSISTSASNTSSISTSTTSNVASSTPSTTSVNSTTQTIESTPTQAPSTTTTTNVVPTTTTTTTQSTNRTKPTNLSNATLYIVGDSTVDEFLDSSGKTTDTNLFYERCGWGGHIKDYVDNTKLTVKNYGSSGRSSKDYLTNSNTVSKYNEIVNNIKEGDYLMIGFGHNDEKSEDSERFTDASKPTTDSTSFKYSLYENYIKLAKDHNATPILCTPIVRLSTSNSYNNQHITEYGNYRNAIIELGAEKDVKVIDLTGFTGDLYTEIKYDEAKKFHSVKSGLSQTEPNWSTIDGTHINNYGAKTFDYYIATELYKDNDCYLGNYVNDELTKPTEANDLKVNTSYEYKEYSSPNLTSYNPSSSFSVSKTGWYGTAFGDLGGNPTSSSNGYQANYNNEIFTVGTSKLKGKISKSTQGFAMAFTQVSSSRNFTLTATATIKTTLEDISEVKEKDKINDGFGLIISDACWLVDGDKTKDSSLYSNYSVAGIWRQSSSSIIANYFKSSTNDLSSMKNPNTASENKLSTMYTANDTFTLTLKRVGQQTYASVTYKGTTYNSTVTDLAYDNKDTDYFYVGMMATRGTLVDFSNVTFTDDGDAGQA